MRGLLFVVRAGAVVAATVVLAIVLTDGGSDALGPVAARASGASNAPRAKEAQPQKPRVPAAHRQVVTISAVGDTVMGSAPDLPPRGGATFFSEVESELAADVVLGNLEGTLSTGGTSKCGPSSSNCFAFQTPPSYARWLKRAGFTVLSLANNHANDFGQSGLRQTVAALGKHGIKTTGRPGEIAIQRVGDARVAVVGFAPYPWAQSLTDLKAAKAIVARASRRADLVVVTMHGGAEGAAAQRVPRGPETYLGESRGNLRAFSHAVVDAGADLVVGHGPHVLRGMEWYRNRLIAYSLGNFAGYGVFALDGPLAESGVLRVTLRGNGRFEGGLLVPTRLVGKGFPALDPEERAHGSVRRLSKADFGARAAKIQADGSITR